MPELTPDQRSRILRTFLAMDPYAAHSTPDPATWETFSYHGRITLDGLLNVAFIVTCLLYGPHMQSDEDADTDACAYA